MKIEKTSKAVFELEEEELTEIKNTKKTIEKINDWLCTACNIDENECNLTQIYGTSLEKYITTCWAMLDLLEKLIAFDEFNVK